MSRERQKAEGAQAQFQRVISPHLPAAYNLARWLTRNDQDAEDVVQEACLRAFQHLDALRGENGRAWLLTIVRNHCYTWLKRSQAREQTVPFDVENEALFAVTAGPETLLLQNVEMEILRRAVEELPVEFREILVLREMEQLSYKEIAQVADLPIGTVMSRLARARTRIQQYVQCCHGEEA